MAEEWKDIEGYEGLYQVSNCGRVRSFHKDKVAVIVPNKIPNGYFVIHLRKGGKRKAEYLHRLVATAFIPNPKGLSDVDHIDNDKTNNNVNNLQWLTNCDNIRKEQSKAIIRIDKQGNEVRYDACMDAVREGFNKCGIWRCLNGVRKTHHGYFWKYAE